MSNDLLDDDMDTAIQLAIARKQMADLYEMSQQRPFNLEEVRIYDLLAANIKKLKEKEKDNSLSVEFKKMKSLETIPTATLVKALETKKPGKSNGEDPKKE